MRPWTAPPVSRHNQRRRLQWGHGLAAVDGACPTMRATRHRSFNGATALRPWTAEHGWPQPRKSSWLQWGHGLAAVDGRCEYGVIAEPTPASMGPRPCGRGRRPKSGRRRVPCMASMGPRPCGRGRRVNARNGDRAAAELQWGHGLAAVDGRSPKQNPPARIWCFNGATALRPWTALAPSRCMPSWKCFNGATALRPWTDRIPAQRDGRRCGLQWGHGLAAVDGLVPDRVAELVEELQWGHGLAAVDGRFCAGGAVFACCFNGATALRPWTAAALPHHAAGELLQWGHGLAAVDGPL